MAINNGFGNMGGAGGGGSNLQTEIAELSRKLSTADNYSALFDTEKSYLEFRKDCLDELIGYQERLYKDELAKRSASQLKAEKAFLEKKHALAAKAADAELKKARKNNKKLSKEEEAAIVAKTIAEFRLKADQEKKLRKQAERSEARAEAQKQKERLANSFFGKGVSIENRLASLKGISPGAFLEGLVDAMSSYALALKGQINTIAGYKSAVDTRLQGSNLKRKKGSYWDQLSSDITGIAGLSPLVKQADISSRVRDYVNKGIAFNVEQRAFLDVIKDKIATTFEATDGTLLRLVRIQQADTTAARLGMESALTAFLNNMYETTEYMTDQARAIRASLAEAEALLGATSATSFEYQVQKWMGSLYSVGFSNTDKIASTLGRLAAGDVSALTGEGTGNLLIMAANRAGLSVADMLANGLDSSETNTLLQSAVNYLGGLYKESKGSNVIAQQLAGVFGLTASDLKAAANLAGSTSAIARQNLNYGGMLGRLNQMAGSMYSRTSLGERLSNAFANIQYSMSAGIANNPALYATYTLASLLKETTGGINIALPVPFVGFKNINIADTMLTGALAGGILSSIGKMITMGGGGGITGTGMLRALGIGSGLATLSRGSGLSSLKESGITTSNANFIGNTEGGDVQNKSLTDQESDTKNSVAQAQAESEETDLNDVNESVIAIYKLLQEVVNGDKSFSTTTEQKDIWGMWPGNL